MLLQVILEGIGLGVLLILVCAIGICKGAVGHGASLQPGGAAAVRERWGLQHTRKSSAIL